MMLVSKKPSLLIALGVLALLLIAGVAYFWATSAIDSLYAFRSPLANDPPAPAPALGNPLTRRVVFVLIDGLRKDTADDASVMPFLAELRAQGASATVHSEAPSFSAPSYTVLFTGAWPDVSDGPAVNLDYDQYWTWTQDNIFSAANRAGLRTAVSGYNWFEKLIPQAAVADHFYTPGEDATADRAVVDAALPWLKSVGDQLVLIHLDQVDYAGHHEGGAESPNWSAAARRSDDLLREIVATLDLGKDTVLVTSDHGHIDRGGHGGPEPILLLQPLVLAGAGIKPGTYGDTYQVDTGPTVAALLGANVPATAQGQARTEMLALASSSSQALTAAETEQKRTIAQAYGMAINEPVTGEISSAEQATEAMAAAKAARLNAERLPRLILGLLVLAAFVVALIRMRGRDLAWGLLAAVAYLVVFNFRYLVLSHRTYSLTTVTGAGELITYVLINTLLAFIIGWLVFAFGTRLFLRPAGEAVRSTLAWALLTVLITGLPALVSFVWNGPLIAWTMPEFWTFFLGFLATLQILFIALFGIIFAGVAAAVARIRRPVARVS
jgi:hypothetical protein